MQALLAAVVPRDKLPLAVASNATANQTAVIAGPALGGLIYVAGPAVVYIVCATLFVWPFVSVTVSVMVRVLV